MKIDLKDLTFIIPVRYDHEDRRRNLDTVVRMLTQDFDTTIIIGEQGGTMFKYTDQNYVKFEDEHFHRTKMINDMVRLSTTKFFCNYDADVLIPPMQFVQAIKVLREGKADFVYPYEYQFIRVPKPIHSTLKNDLAAFMHQSPGDETRTRPSLGGAVMFAKDTFLANGGENEKFISFAPEDVERYERFVRLGLKNKRIRGPLYHLNHFVGVNSCKKNPFYTEGEQELVKQREMNNQELKTYVASWQK
jgi:predicted glycosyltransferase involved in capsule biosynthesis